MSPNENSLFQCIKSFFKWQINKSNVILHLKMMINNQYNQINIAYQW